MKMLSLLLLLVFSLFFGGCDLSHSAEVNNQYSATVQPTATVNPTAEPTIENSSNTEKFVESNNSKSSSQAIEDEITNTPEGTVQAFYKAMKERNRKTALKYAKPDVVRQLFKDKESRLEWRFINCEEPEIKDYGDVTCFYFFEGGGTGIFLRKNPNEKYQIVSAYYMAAD